MYYHPRRRQRDANIASEAFAKVTGWREKINRTGNEDDITHGNEDDITYGNEDDITHGNEDDITHGNEDDITHGNDDGASNGDDSESHYDAGKYDIWVLYYCTIP
jgi:hypothetical protein